METQAKLQAQDLIRSGKLEMVTSYMLDLENEQNPYVMRKAAIAEFMENNATVYVSDAKDGTLL